MSTKYYPLYCVVFLLFAFNIGLSQKNVIQNEGIDTYDSIYVAHGDSIRIPIVRNHWMGIEIQGDISEIDSLQGKPVDTTDWNIYRNTKLGVSFCYPPLLKVILDDSYSDTKILLLNSLTRIQSLMSKSKSDPVLTIRLGDFSFDRVVSDEGLVKREDGWYNEGRAPSQATYIKGKDWRGLIGEYIYGTQLDGGGMGLTSEQYFFVLKNITSRYSAIFHCYDLEPNTAVAIISSLRPLNQIHNQIHSSVSDWKANVLVGKSKNLILRIDRTEKGLRYVSWSKGHSMLEKPDLILFNGNEESQGNKGGFKWTFVNEGWTYIIDYVADCDKPDQCGLFLRLLFNGIEKNKIKLKEIK